MRILGIGAHPDDIEIYFSGFMAIAQGSGHQIDWVIATDGGAGGSGDAATLIAQRREEAEAAARLFDVRPICLDRVDGKLSQDCEARSLIDATLRRLQPSLVITHAPNDYHADHRSLSAYVTDAANLRVPVLYADTMLGISFEPSIYVDISAHMERKKQAIALHASQPTAQFLEIVEVWNRFRGLQSGNRSCRYAEAFRFEPRFPFGTIENLLAAATAGRPVAS